jgi:hypothetical protein
LKTEADSEGVPEPAAPSATSDAST